MTTALVIFGGICLALILFGMLKNYRMRTDPVYRDHQIALMLERSAAHQDLPTREFVASVTSFLRTYGLDDTIEMVERICRTELSRELALQLRALRITYR